MPRQHPPTTDPRLPSFECEAFKSIKPTLTHLKNCWMGGFHRWPAEKAKQYLPMNYKEDSGDYAARLKRSRYVNKFRAIIEGYAGAFSKFKVESQLSDEFFNNCDRQGSSFKALIDKACRYGARDKYGFWFAQFWRGIGEPRSRSEELAMGRRPFVTYVQACQVPNWKIRDGQLIRVTIVERHIKAEYAYGDESEVLYRTIWVQDRQVWQRLERMVEPKGASNEWTVQTVDPPYPVLGYSKTPLTQFPIIPFSLSTSEWSQEDEPFPFLQVADLCIQKFQVSSDRREIQHSLPATITISPGEGATVVDEDGSMTVGPGSYLNLGTNGSAGILEPTGSGIPHLFTEEERIDAQIRKESLEYIQDSGPERKELQVKLELEDLQNRLERSANLIESSVQTLLAVLGEYAGVDGGKIEIAIDMSVFLSQIPDLATAVQAGFLSKQTAIERMVQLGHAEDAETEIERLMEQEAKEAEALATALTPDVREEDLASV